MQSGEIRAALDIGTNSVKLVVARVHRNRIVSVLEERVAITRLGEGVGASRRLARPAMRRTRLAAARLARLGRRYLPARFPAAATSAVRDARNGRAFLRALERATRLKVRILGGLEEARLSCRGALSLFPRLRRGLVLDIGGGSAEFVLVRNGRAAAAASHDVGAVRLTERLITRHPVPPDQLAAVRGTVLASLARLNGWPRRARGGFVGVGGTVVTLAGAALGLTRRRLLETDGRRIPARAIAALVRKLAASSVSRRERVFGIEPGRSDVVVAGAVVLDESLRHFRKPSLRVSTRGLRYGLLLEE